MLAEEYERAGQTEEGLTTVAEALATMDKSGERWREAELYWLKGELLLKAEGGTLRVKDEAEAEALRQAQDEAEKRFWQAIEVARRQGARSLELRATVGLCRLWQSEGKRGKASHMLAEIYGWFSEGFDTVDLREAKVLLEELSRK